MRAWALLLVMTAIGRAELIDRIAVIAGTEAITASEISQEIRLAAVMNEAKVDDGAASRRAAAERLIEQALVRREMELGNYSGATDEQATAMIAALEIARGKSVLERQERDAGVTRAQLVDYAKWQASLLQFIDARFRPAVQVTAEDVSKAYQQEAPALKKGVRLSDVREEIEKRLTGERADAELDKWLKETRTTTKVVYLEEGLKP